MIAEYQEDDFSAWDVCMGTDQGGDAAGAEALPTGAISVLTPNGGETLTSLHIPADQWDLSAFDESNAFSFIKTPPWMWAWTCTPPRDEAEYR